MTKVHDRAASQASEADETGEAASSDKRMSITVMQPAGALVGGTNPFMLRALGRWPAALLLSSRGVAPGAGAATPLRATAQQAVAATTGGRLDGGCTSADMMPVSYTHLTLPTKRIV